MPGSARQASDTTRGLRDSLSFSDSSSKSVLWSKGAEFSYAPTRVLGKEGMWLAGTSKDSKSSSAGSLKQGSMEYSGMAGCEAKQSGWDTRQITRCHRAREMLDKGVPPQKV